MILGIILSGGSSFRMKTPKANLKFDDGTALLERQVTLLQSSGIAEIIVVIGAHADEIKNPHNQFNIKWVINPNWELGQFSSIQTGIDAIKDTECDGTILLPVDVVGVSLDTVTTLIDTASFNNHLKIITVEYNGHGGHPIFISKKIFNELLNLAPKETRLDIFIRNTKEKFSLPVSDPQVITNINTQEEWDICKKSPNIFFYLPNKI